MVDEIWSSLIRWLVPAIAAGVVWVIVMHFKTNTRLAVIETRLGHLESDKREGR